MRSVRVLNRILAEIVQPIAKVGEPELRLPLPLCLSLNVAFSYKGIEAMSTESLTLRLIFEQLPETTKVTTSFDGLTHRFGYDLFLAPNTDVQVVIRKAFSAIKPSQHCVKKLATRKHTHENGTVEVSVFIEVALVYGHVFNSSAQEDARNA